MIQASTLFKDLVNGLTGLYDKNEATSIVRIVFNEKLGISRTDLAVEPLRQISKNDEEKITRIAKKLLEGIPVQYALGYTDFCGLRLKVNKNTLIPRPETEELVQMIIKEKKRRIGLHILDIGTGSGCIAIALKKALKDPDIDAIDINPLALEVAKANASAHNAKINFIRHDIFEEKSWGNFSRYDIIVSNPPYVAEKEKAAMHVNVLNHEPHSALFVPDDDPLKFYERIATIAYENLWRNGRLFLEINPAYSEMTKKLFMRGRKFQRVQLLKDFAGKERFIACKVNFPPKPIPYSIWTLDSLGG